MKIFPRTLLFLVLILSANLSFAEDVKTTSPREQTSAVMSPKCDEAKLKELAGDALISVKKTDWEKSSGYTITLDTTKMDFATLTKKMLAAGCF
jgi:hypothetical protein